MFVFLVDLLGRLMMKKVVGVMLWNVELRVVIIFIRGKKYYIFCIIMY